MIIIKLSGGLGNQLQQYALYEKLYSMNKQVKLDTSWFQNENKKALKRELELNYFPQISYEICTEEEIKSILGNRSIVTKVFEKIGLKEKRIYREKIMYDSSIFQLDNMILEGYFACEEYYRDRIPVLQEILTFPVSYNEENKEIIERINSHNSISIHVRRGDYLTEENQEIFGGICTEAYYTGAIEYIKEKVENPHFYIFSDDIDYVQEKYQNLECTIVDINHNENSFYDMYLMSLCKHNICANSTFSFWGARLNKNKEKVIIRPLKQRNNCDWYQPEIMKKYWNAWTLIDEKGQII